MASDIFLKLEGIKGEATADGHKEEIELLSWSFGVSNAGSGTGAGAGAGKAHFQDLSFTTHLDASAPPLMQSVATGKHFAKAQLVQRKAGGTQLEYIKIELEEVFITSSHVGGSDMPTCNYSITFSKIKFEYQPQDEKGAKKGGAIPGTFDLKAVKK
ncbi:MAG: type VI secretion system tube protein Hcp [Betaproteobacteria bacterium]|nr:type VI secretion system tube protein Hcp [Pseudomonadota bacterium]